MLDSRTMQQEVARHGLGGPRCRRRRCSGGRAWRRTAVPRLRWNDPTRRNSGPRARLQRALGALPLPVLRDVVGRGRETPTGVAPMSVRGWPPHFDIGEVVELRDAAFDAVGTVVAVVSPDRVRVQWNTGHGYMGKTLLISTRVLRHRRDPN